MSMCERKNKATTTDDLSPARRRLLEMIVALRFGRVEDLQVRGGEPVLDPAPRLVRTEKFGAARPPVRRDLGCPELKKQMIDLLELLGRVGTGMVLLIQVGDGLPLWAEVQQAARPGPRVE